MGARLDMLQFVQSDLTSTKLFEIRQRHHMWFYHDIPLQRHSLVPLWIRLMSVLVNICINYFAASAFCRRNFMHLRIWTLAVFCLFKVKVVAWFRLVIVSDIYKVVIKLFVQVLPPDVLWYQCFHRVKSVNDPCLWQSARGVLWSKIMACFLLYGRNDACSLPLTHRVP